MHARYARFSQPHTEANFTKSGRTSGGARFPRARVRARSWNGIFQKVDAFRFLGHRHNSKTCFCGSIMFRFFYCSRKKMPKNHRHPLNVSCCNIFGFFLPFSQPKCIPIDTSESWVISSSIITLMACFCIYFFVLSFFELHFL